MKTSLFENSLNGARSLNDLIRDFPLGNTLAHPLRLGVIGLGGVAMKCHFPALRVLRENGWDVEITALADIDPVRLANARASVPSVRTFKNARDLIASGLCEAVLVLTWPPLSLEITRLAVKAGLAVFVEKPVSDDLEELSALEAESRQCGGVVQVGYNRRHQIFATLFRKELDSWGEAPVSVRARLWRSDRSEHGFYEDTLVHSLDFLLHVFGPLKLVYAQWMKSGNASLPTGVNLNLLAERGEVPITISSYPAIGRNIESIEVQGDRRSAILSYSPVEKHCDPARMATISGGSMEVKACASTSNHDLAAMNYVRGFVHQMAAFCRLAADSAHSPNTCSLREAVDRLVLCDEILETRIPSESFHNGLSPALVETV